MYTLPDIYAKEEGPHCSEVNKYRTQDEINSVGMTPTVKLNALLRIYSSSMVLGLRFCLTNLTKTVLK